MKEEKLLGMLSTKPVKQEQLARQLGCRPSEVRMLIHNLRMSGVRICTGYDGVWLWNGVDNSWELTKNHIRSRAISLFNLLSAMELAYEGQGEQIQI